MSKGAAISLLREAGSEMLSLRVVDNDHDGLDLTIRVDRQGGGGHVVLFELDRRHAITLAQRLADFIRR